MSHTLDAAFDIAWAYLNGAGLIQDKYVARVQVTQSILALQAKGVENKLRLANAAIVEFQQPKAPTETVLEDWFGFKKVRPSGFAKN